MRAQYAHDYSLAETLRSHDDSSWDSFYQRFESLIIRVVSWGKWSFSADLRDDVAQTIRVELKRAIDRYRGDCSLEYFVKRICIYCCIDALKKEIRRREILQPLMEEDGAGGWKTKEFPSGKTLHPVDEIVRVERIKVLRQEMEKLGDTCKTAVRFFYINDMSYKEIAKRLGIAVNTVGTRLLKCLKKLKTTLRGYPVFSQPA